MITFNDQFTSEDGGFRSKQELFHDLRDANIKIETAICNLNTSAEEYEKSFNNCKELMNELKRIEFAIQGQLNNRNEVGIRTILKQLDEWLTENGYL